MFHKSTLIAFLAFLLPSAAFASGGFGGGGSSYSSPEPAQRVDQAYEYGKSLYFGRVKGQVISYCIVSKGESTPIKRSSIREARGLSYAELGNALHNCSDIQQSMASILNDSQLNAVAYYLNKRYRLRLRRA